MDNNKIADFISELRKARGMTQKQLAEKLNITDKAVSKWERGMGYPDITILSSLAEALGVTTSELLNGQKDNIPAPEADIIVQNTLQYADKVTKGYKTTVSNVAMGIISCAFLIGIFVCILCDYLTSNALDWSVISVSAVIFAWLILMPLFYCKKYKIVAALVTVSIFIIPFLYIVEAFGPVKGWFSSTGVPVAVMSLIYSWVVCSLYSFTKINPWYVSAIAVFLSIGLDLGITYLVIQDAAGLRELDTVISTFSSLIAGTVLIVIGRLYPNFHLRKREKTIIK